MNGNLINAYQLKVDNVCNWPLTGWVESAGTGVYPLNVGRTLGRRGRGQAFVAAVLFGKFGSRITFEVFAP